jgi:hypothetical protein
MSPPEERTVCAACHAPAPLSDPACAYCGTIFATDEELAAEAAQSDFVRRWWWVLPVGFVGLLAMRTDGRSPGPVVPETIRGMVVGVCEEMIGDRVPAYTAPRIQGVSVSPWDPEPLTYAYLAYVTNLHGDPRPQRVTCIISFASGRIDTVAFAPR